MAKEGGKVWMKHGALSYYECIGEDLEIKGMDGKVGLTFPKLTKLKKGEAVWYSFITYKSRKHRDQVNAKVMKEMMKCTEKHKDMKMPFDMKRMAYGGFTVAVGF